MDYNVKTAILSWFHFDTYRNLCEPLDLKPWHYIGMIYNPYITSVMTCAFMFKNFTLHEQLDTPNLKFTDKILLIGSNYHESISPRFVVNPVIKKSNRGRPAKPKRTKKKKLGNGKYFNTSTSFFIPEVFGKDQWINSPKFDKIYKFKVYRTGRGQVPGVLHADKSDVAPKLEILRKFLSDYSGKELEFDPIEECLHMCNIKTKLTSTNIELDIVNVAKVLMQAEEDKDPINIWDIVMSSNSKITVKFSRPSKKKAHKVTTLVITKQLLTVEGAAHIKDGEEIIYWINDLILYNYDTCVEDPLFVQVIYSDSSDTDDCEVFEYCTQPQCINLDNQDFDILSPFR